MNAASHLRIPRHDRRNGEICCAVNIALQGSPALPESKTRSAGLQLDGASSRSRVAPSSQAVGPRDPFGTLADAAVDLERFRIDRAICLDRVEEAVQVLSDSLDDWYSRLRGEQLRQAEHVVCVLANVPGVDRLTLGLTFAEVQPGAGLERNQPVLADPRQAVDFPASCKDELVVRVIEQDRGQAATASSTGIGVR